jgi:hypothetical protein
MITDLARATFLFWGIVNVVIVFGAFSLIKETKNSSLEDTNTGLLGNTDAFNDRASSVVETKLTKDAYMSRQM